MVISSLVMTVFLLHHWSDYEHGPAAATVSVVNINHYIITSDFSCTDLLRVITCIFVTSVLLNKFCGCCDCSVARLVHIFMAVAWTFPSRCSTYRNNSIKQLQWKLEEWKTTFLLYFWEMKCIISVAEHVWEALQFYAFKWGRTALRSCFMKEQVNISVCILMVYLWMDSADQARRRSETIMSSGFQREVELIVHVWNKRFVFVQIWTENFQLFCGFCLIVYFHV